MDCPATLVHNIADWATRTPAANALHRRRPDGSWQTWTWRDYWRDVRAIAKGLIALGHQPGQKVALVGKNRPEWMLCQFGIMTADGVPAPIYATNTLEQLAYIVSQSESVLAIGDDQEQIDKYLGGQTRGLMSVSKIISMDDRSNGHGQVISLAELMKLGESVSDAQLDARIAAIDPDATALLIYTSGTTGLPKGAELSHRGMLSVANAVKTDYPALDHPQVGLSYLPLCHVAEQIFSSYLPLATGSEIYFCAELKQVRDYLPLVRPTVLLGVPRVWEKVEAALRAKFAAATGLKAKLLAWAMRTELGAFHETLRTGRPVDSLSRRLAHKLVLSKIHAALGLDRLKMAASGAAPIATSTLELFASLGIVIHEGFGMTETSGVATVQTLGRPVFGTVGHALSGVQVKIGDDGEILLKGPNMTKGYYNKPEETAALFTADGWLHTGDLGVFESGKLKITGRKKDLIITAGGKNVAPAEVEQFISGIPGVGQVMVVGDRKPYLTLLLALDADSHAALAAAAGVPAKPIAELAQDPAVRSYIEAWLEEHCNKHVARYQTIKRFQIVPAPFSVDSGEVTPTMKVKRNVVMEKYRTLIDGMYEEPVSASAAVAGSQSRAAP